MERARNRVKRRMGTQSGLSPNYLLYKKSSPIAASQPGEEKAIRLTGLGYYCIICIGDADEDDA
jgi:hypothetical protein